MSTFNIRLIIEETRQHKTLDSYKLTSKLNCKISFNESATIETERTRIQTGPTGHQEVSNRKNVRLLVGEPP